MKLALAAISSFLLIGCATGDDEPIESGATLGDTPLTQEYCDGLLDGGILDDEVEFYDQCRNEGFLDDDGI